VPSPFHLSTWLRQYKDKPNKTTYWESRTNKKTNSILTHHNSLTSKRQTVVFISFFFLQFFSHKGGNWCISLACKKKFISIVIFCQVGRQLKVIHRDVHCPAPYIRLYKICYICIYKSNNNHFKKKKRNKEYYIILYYITQFLSLLLYSPIAFGCCRVTLLSARRD